MGYSKNEHHGGNTGKFLTAWDQVRVGLGCVVQECQARSPSLAVVLSFFTTRSKGILLSVLYVETGDSATMEKYLSSPQLARLPLLLSSASNSKSSSSIVSTSTPLAPVWASSGTCGSWKTGSGSTGADGQ